MRPDMGRHVRRFVGGDSRRRSLGVVLILVVALALLAFLACRPASAQTQPLRPLDEELMKDLGAKPVDEIDRELFGGAKPGDREPPKDEFRTRVIRELGRAAEREDENPLLKVARGMREAEGLIRRHNSGPATQNVQQDVVEELERLIRDARKICKQSQLQSSTRQGTTRTPLGSNPNPNAKPPSPKTATTSTQRKDGPEAKQPDMGEVLEGMKRIWGNLPMRQREQVQELPVEEFLPKYRALIEAYFRALSGAASNDERSRRNDEPK